MLDTSAFERLRRERTEATNRILESTEHRKLIVAGPGTGKTYTFKKALERVGANEVNQGLGLTFIRNLVADLEDALQGLAHVFTFHGFCTHLMHRLSFTGLSATVDFYPELPTIISSDATTCGRNPIAKEDVQQAFHDLNFRSWIIEFALRCGAYYNAVSFDDVVYRGLTHLQANEEDIPRFPLIVVDEYQDFNRLETMLIAELTKKSPVLIAGDDDQALYAFKNASADYIREIAAPESDYELFGLPYCSRCTEVLVNAVKEVVSRAERNGNLTNRLHREYRCYLPDKREDSAAHPRIIHAHCSVHMRSAPYICRYVAEQINAIPSSDIAESHDASYPTVLVIGPMHFVSSVHGHLAEHGFPQAVLRRSAVPELDLLEGYHRLSCHEESRLGWRIVLQCDRPNNYEDIVSEAITRRAEFSALLHRDYRNGHLVNSRLVSRIVNGQTLNSGECQVLESALSRPMEEIQRDLLDDCLKDEDDSVDTGDAPTVVCTSLVGAKGLSAGYVFLVGFNDRDFPTHANAIIDTEVCCFIVALSRARKACQLVSCGRYAGQPRRVSRFVDWIAPFVETRNVDRGYWRQ
jgi:superfamily I DNA/RNA helicase